MSSAPSPRHDCPACGTPNQSFATFCHECGEPLDGGVPGGVAAAVGRGHRWELWIGLVLIAGVLGFALLDWGQREAQARLYRSGVEAATARHWDTAAAAFAGLGDYRDSAQWRDQASRAILTRDTTFIAGNEAAAGHDWITAYQALSQTVAIEPGYRNAQALFDTATREAQRQALAGAILRRTDGPAPGLYVREAEGSERRLEGSDAASVVWATDPAPGHILYDGPDPAGSATPPPTGLLSPALRQLPPDRHLLIADARTPEQPPVRLPSWFEQPGPVLLARQGVWSLRIGESDVETTTQPVVGFPLAGLEYDDFQSGPSAPNVPLDHGTFLLDADPVGQQLLLGHYDPVATAHPRTRLYRLTGGLPQLLADVSGVVLEAELAPDGTALLYAVETGESLPYDVEVVLVRQDLTQPDQPGQEIYSRRFLSEPDHAELPQAWLLPGHPARVLLQLRPNNPLIVHDMEAGTDTAVWEPVDQARPARYWTALDGRTLFVDEVAAGAADRHTLVVQPLTRGTPAQRIPLPPVERGAHTLLLDAQQVGPQMVIRTLYVPPNATSDDSRPRSYDERLYSVAATGPVTAPVLLGQQPIDLQDILGGMAPQLEALPAGVLAYPGADGALYLRTLDGAGLLPPVPGVNAVWTFHPVPGLLSWNR
jgi:hypothetical protein